MLTAFDGGSTFDADYPRKWVNIACRLTKTLRMGNDQYELITA